MHCAVNNGFKRRFEYCHKQEQRVIVFLLFPLHVDRGTKLQTFEINSGEN